MHDLSRTAVLALAILGLAVCPVRAEAPPPPPPPPPSHPAAAVLEPTVAIAEVLRLCQQVIAHVAAAELAIDRGDVAAARRALDLSQRSLRRLRAAPALAAVIDELDTAISRLQGREVAAAIELAPLTATVRGYQAFIDPAVVEGVAEAESRARRNDRLGSASALKLARHRMAVDVAFLPIEEAQVHVLAAQQALDDGDPALAARVLRGVPLTVSQARVSTPLVPVRFKLNAAALAAEQGDWGRARLLVRGATELIDELEMAAKGTPTGARLNPIVDEVQALDKQLDLGTRPPPEDIRQAALRTRGLELGA